MSNYISQRASSLSEFVRTLEIHAERVMSSMWGKDKIIASTRLCEYLCDNSRFISERPRLSSTIEEALVRFWKRDSWIAARFYLQRLYPMNSDLSKWKKTFKVFRARKHFQKSISPIDEVLIPDLLQTI